MEQAFRRSKSRRATVNLSVPNCHSRVRNLTQIKVAGEPTNIVSGLERHDGYAAKMTRESAVTLVIFRLENQ